MVVPEFFLVRKGLSFQGFVDNGILSAGGMGQAGFSVTANVDIESFLS